MRRSLVVLSLAVVAAVPVLAQISPVQIRRPVQVAPVTTVQQSPNAGVIEPWMTPETAKALSELFRVAYRNFQNSENK